MKELNNFTDSLYIENIYLASHCVESILIQSFYGPHFPGTIRTRKTPSTDTFHVVSTIDFSQSFWIALFLLTLAPSYIQIMALIFLVFAFTLSFYIDE